MSPADPDPPGFLPDGYDPDSYIREHGAAALCALIGIAYRPGLGDEIGPTGEPRRARLQRRAVAWVCPEEQERRWAEMLERQERDALRATAARWASGELAADFAIMAEAAERKRLAEMRASLDRIETERARLLGEGRPIGDPSARASAYLSHLGVGPNDAFYATLCAVRGFALGEGEGARLVLAEYAPRYHRALRPSEVADMARRAMRARKPWGWLLTAERPERPRDRVGAT